MPAARDVVDPQPLRLEPDRNLRKIAGAQTETIAELLRSQPALIIRRKRISLPGEKRLQQGRWSQPQSHIPDPRCRIKSAAVELRLRFRVDVALENHRPVGVHWH